MRAYLMALACRSLNTKIEERTARTNEGSGEVLDKEDKSACEDMDTTESSEMQVDLAWLVYL